MLELLREKGISTDYLVAAEGFQTPLKSRILSGGDNTKKQQILRIDTLPPGPLGERARQKLAKALFSVLAESDLLILSDYLAKTVTPGIFQTPEEIISAHKSVLWIRGTICWIFPA